MPFAIEVILTTFLIIIVTVVFIIIILIYLSPAIGLFYLQRYLNKKGFTKARYITIPLIVIYILYSCTQWYYAFYPKDSFYIKEAKRGISSEFPEDVAMINKYASYPSIHGEYCSYFIAELKSHDFKELITALDLDTNFKKSDSIYSWQMPTDKDIKITVPSSEILQSFYSKPDIDGNYSQIGFCKDSTRVLFDTYVN